MNIYLVSQDDITGYDTYDSFVCVANSAEEARNLHPCGKKWNGKDYDGIPAGYVMYYGWTTPSNVKVNYIGVAEDSYKEATIILASYNGEW